MKSTRKPYNGKTVSPWRILRAFLTSLTLLTALPAFSTVIFQVQGPDAAAIQATVDSFRAALGANNGNATGTLPGGRREVNWDGTPAPQLDPFPGDFFNTTVPRGVEFTSPDASRLKVSGEPGSGSFQFEDVTALIPSLGVPWGPIELASFSGNKMFAPIDSIITDVGFFVPGTTTSAMINAFGAVLVDVDDPGASMLELFGANDQLLFSQFFAPSGVQSKGLSFLGVILPTSQFATRARITAGTHPMNTGFLNPTPDGVAIDDVIFSEPQAVPAPTTVLLLIWGLSLLVIGGKPGIVRLRWQREMGGQSSR